MGPPQRVCPLQRRRASRAPSRPARSVGQGLEAAKDHEGGALGRGDEGDLGGAVLLPAENVERAAGGEGGASGDAEEDRGELVPIGARQGLLVGFAPLPAVLG